MRELARTARQWAAEGRTGVLARPLTEQGFGPRHPADAVLIDQDGHCLGTLYRGVFDAYLVTEAAALPAGRTACVREVSVHDDEVRRAGLTCGGQAEVLLQSLHTVPARWWELLADGADVALITWLDEGRTTVNSTVATPAPAADDGPAEAVARARELLARRRAGRDARSTDDGLVLIETFPAVPHLVIVGGGELAELLVAQAHLLGWQATVESTVHNAVRLLTERPAAACLIVLSHDPDVDTPVLSTALTAGIAYVGALGSRRTQARRAADLVAAGLDEGHLARIHGPIGLDLGARTPAETALAVCAEVLAALDGREARVPREGDGPVNA
ncbi:xanthine dehydrogenase accessory factor [Streptomyces griseochromogenes]|uniref:Xanthine dehydrogenase n=1 Tax=Streptomyces griseochromogenes TaxID=68214 RepID=A0A1B1B0Z0_9ACTN|nr:XdhC family protein [Streptomyces griseochromogenes]ANP52474.1 xanthine dehydrogenase [Streptomyces griseochromogenes]MBP2055959.1 xanthine dehydrogenase accessory factor [Streptomyces griseochromogenes]